MVLSLLLLVACGSDKAEDPCTGLDDLASGTLTADIDGTEWIPDDPAASWADSALQVTTTATDGYRLTLALQSAVDGETAKAAVESGDLPVEINLSGSGGFGLLYPDGAGSQKSESGTAWIDAWDAGSSLARVCFTFSTGDIDLTGGQLALQVP